MSAKKKEGMFGMDDIAPRARGSAAAMPIDISGGVRKSQDYAEIPCEKICSYRKRDQYDTVQHDSPEYQALVVSITEKGVYAPIIVRPIFDDELNSKGIEFELIDGHHRLDASKEAKKKTVPAKIIRDCSDAEAEDIYQVTTILRKKQSLRQLSSGWWHYFNMVRYKSPEEIDDLICQGEVSESFKIIRDSKGNRQLRRYASLHNLTDEMMKLVEDKIISINFGVEISYIDKSLQNDLLEYRASLKTPKKAQQLRALAEGKIEGEKWGRNSILKILFPPEQAFDKEKKTDTDAEFMKMLRETIPSSYHNHESMLSLIQDAMTEYFEAHPEKLQP